MGCAIPTGHKTTITMFSSQTEADRKVKLERKLYLAKETPEAIFDLSGCYLKQIPSGIFSICKVLRKESLLLNDNKIRSLQDGGELSDLYLIKILDLSHNLFTKLDDLSTLINLNELNLKGNQLKMLPESIGNLINLRALNVSENDLTSIPWSLGELRNLRSLDIRGNIDLKYLNPHLCGAYNLMNLNLDSDNFCGLPSVIAEGGTESIMRYLCMLAKTDYRKPDATLPESPPYENTITFDIFYKTNPASFDKEERRILELQNQMQATKIQRRQFLEELTAEKIKLDAEVAKICDEREVDRLKLLGHIKQEEDVVQGTVLNLMELNSKSPQRMQQMMQLEQTEHDRLLELCRENYNNIRKVDTLKAMESFVKEECQRDISMQRYGLRQSEVKQGFLFEELSSSSRLTDLFKQNDEVHSQFVHQLLDEENVQKAAVASLLEKVDSRTWSLIQEVSIVQNNLAKLSAIELNKRKLNVGFNIETLAEQRLQLSHLLVDLLDQQEKRRGQLVDTLKEMEIERNDSTDFWLNNYQRLLESAPPSFLQTKRNLDPILANHLLQMGVIHCLPFLVKWVFSKEELSRVTDSDLRRKGVMLSEDRRSILKAIMYYLDGTDEKSKSEATTSEYIHPICVESPSAPPAHFVNESEPPSEEITALNKAECVICMDRSCEIVYVPCGHLCCCIQCSETVPELCPLCRQNIERKIRVIQP